MGVGLWMMIIRSWKNKQDMKPYGKVPRLGKIAICLVLIAIAAGLILYLAVLANLIR